MKFAFASIAVAAGLIASASAFAQAPAGAPAGSTGLCKDGSYTSNATKKGACAGHKGVKDWFAAGTPAGGGPGAAATAATAGSAAAPAPTAAGKPTGAGGPAAAAVTPTAAPAKKTATALPATPAAGGGADKVWVNTGTKVYHCPGTKYYGKTKEGEYMTEAAAKAAGDHADHGKACTAG